MIDRDIAGERRTKDRVLVCLDNNDADEGSSYIGGPLTTSFWEKISTNQIDPILVQRTQQS
jgi:hypothetical protein